jgi:hypothetical protein
MSQINRISKYGGLQDVLAADVGHAGVLLCADDLEQDLDDGPVEEAVARPVELRLGRAVHHLDIPERLVLWVAHVQVLKKSA